jgi:hypothetical protein
MRWCWEFTFYRRQASRSRVASASHRSNHRAQKCPPPTWSLASVTSYLCPVVPSNCCHKRKHTHWRVCCPFLAMQQRLCALPPLLRPRHTCLRVRHPELQDWRWPARGCLDPCTDSSLTTVAYYWSPNRRAYRHL